MNPKLVIDNKEIVIRGKVVKTAGLRAEYYELVDQPTDFLQKLKDAGIRADLFTFLQGAADRTPHFDYHLEWESIAVMPITTYDVWWKSLKDKTRNMVRKAAKTGVELRMAEFNDELVQGIVEIYNETPIRQGRRFKHYGKDFETIKRDHASYLDRSEFIGAYFEGKLIGFIKLVHGNNVSNLMQIISMVRYRDKAPTNALIAKAVEICAAKKVPNLHYGLWGRKGIRDFKIHHKFEKVEVPRYFVPLNLKGELLLKGRLHHNLSEYLPETWVDYLTLWRSKWYSAKYKEQTALGR